MKFYLLCLAKYQQEYIYDWVKYHLNLGIDKIIICDNEQPNSSVNYSTILRDFNDKITILDYRKYQNCGFQHWVYNDIYHNYHEIQECDYVGVIDIDQYIYLNPKYNSIKDFLNELLPFDILTLNWKNININQQNIYKKNISLQQRYKNIDLSKIKFAPQCKGVYKINLPIFIWIHNCWFENNKIEIKNSYFATSPIPTISQEIIVKNASNKNLNYIGPFVQKDEDRSDNVFIKHYLHKSLQQFIVKCTYNTACDNTHRKLTNFPQLINEISNNIQLIKSICKKHNVNFQDIY